MDVIALGILVFSAILICWGIWQEYFKDEKVEVLYGYPAYRNTWLTVYYYRRSKRWVFERDDLFAEPRSKNYKPISQHFLYASKKTATPEEIANAWRLCRESGLL